MRHFIDHSMDKVTLLLDKATGEEAGKILAYYTDNPAGSVCHAKVIMYRVGDKILGREESDNDAEGRAGGYGYDKYSAAVADCLHKMGLSCNRGEMDAFTFHNSDDKTTGVEEKRKEQLAWIVENKKIPVYSGSGNVRQAFEIYFRVIEVL